MTEDEVSAYFGAKTDNTVVKRRWEVFLAVEFGSILCFIILLTLLICRQVKNPWLSIALIPFSLWFAITLPICFLYLIGKPPVMSLAPLIPSWHARAFARLLNDRPLLDDDEFSAKYYPSSDVPKEVVTRLRKCLVEIDVRVNRIIPSDSLELLDDELDLADVERIVEREFHISFTWDEYPRIDGTFANLVDLICEKLAPSESQRRV